MTKERLENLTTIFFKIIKEFTPVQGYHHYIDVSTNRVKIYIDWENDIHAEFHIHFEAFVDKDHIVAMAKDQVLIYMKHRLKQII